MKDAFDVLMTEMDQKGDQKLVSHGKFNFTYQEAAKALKDANNFKATEYSVKVANKINNKLTELVKEVTPPELTRNMKEKKGPAFQILTDAMKKKGSDVMYRKNKTERTYGQAAQLLERAEGLESDHDDPNLSQEIHATMTELVKNQFPEDMKKDMDGIVDVSSKYLSQVAVDDTDRGPVFDFLIKNLIEHGDQPFSDIFPLTTSSAAAHIIQEAPDLITHLHIKDIADEGKTNLTKDMKNVTPDALQAPMAALIKDVSKYLSQMVALRSGIAGDRYPKSLLASMEKSMGKKPLYKYRSYGQSYAEAADVLQHGGPSVTPESQQPTEPASDLAQKSLTESKHRLLVSEGLSYDDIHPTKSTKELGFEIATEMKKTLPKQVAPDVAAGLEDTIDKAATQIAKHAGGQGKALEHLTNLMKEKGDEKLARLQGYDQTYSDAAKRLENTPTLNTEKVDKSAYEIVKAKLTDLTKDKPANEKVEKHIPGMLKHAPAGVNKAHDEQKKEEMIKKIEAVFPDKKMAAAYKEPITEGAAHLADVVTGRGEAMEVIQDSLNKKKDKPFLDVGSFKKTHGQIAELLKNAPNLHGEKASPVLMENVEHQLNVLPKEVPADKPLAKQHMKDTTQIAAKYIASKATAEMKHFEELHKKIL
ncbi:unnamed protein product [Spodoptera exigua]|nr:unnamed protein product [Spodoptera exigua]